MEVTTNMPSIKNRDPYIDNARAIAIIAVVLSHTMSQIINMRNDPSGLLCEHIIVMFDMPLFTILAGFCGFPSLLRIENARILIAYIFKQWKRLMLPAGFLCLLYNCCIGGLLENQIRLIVNFFYPGIFWYLIMLFGVCSFIGVCSYLGSKIGKYRLTLICLASLLVLPIRFLHIGEMMPYFIVGMLLRKYDILNKVRVNTVYIISIPICIVLILFYDNNYHIFNNFYNVKFIDYIHSNGVHFWVIRFIICSILSIFIILICKLYNKTIPFLTKTGCITLPLFTFSSLFFVSFKIPVVNNYITNSDLYAWAISSYSHRVISVFVIFSLITLISELLILVADRYKISRLLLIGK